jgi:plasmid stabilization system protein ParE
VKLVISPSAADDIEAASRWWDANRPGAPQLFQRELLTALGIIEQSPRSLAASRDTSLGEVRRAVMPKSRYLVYFRVLKDEVRILRVWHQSRSTPPL